MEALNLAGMTGEINEALKNAIANSVSVNIVNHVFFDLERKYLSDIENFNIKKKYSRELKNYIRKLYKALTK